ncbi:hypothetical protein KYE74_04075 [Bifidobacterium pseudocatenulatum]|uniref:hypothetical protein n=1 Tax=Bifidobacterium pseudocatenulatum TaxID=28026 RepID=UPI001D00EFC3|nr:hypothetical protein [Bifidobacterium pseudocatenulatum]UDG88990.1 hypothetical protein KYE74_04075 [Bifidobacterium pseudocatenulatum]
MADAAATAAADSASNVTTTAGSPTSGGSNASVTGQIAQVSTTQAEEALQNLVNDNPATEEPETSEEQQRNEPEPETMEPEDTGEEIEGEAELGDKGKKALNRMKAAVKSSKHEAETLKARISELETRIFNANVEKAATGKLQHPELATRLVEGVDAKSDRKAIDKAIDAILREYPDLGVPAQTELADGSLQQLFDAKPATHEGESRTSANAAVFGSQLAALGL